MKKARRVSQVGLRSSEIGDQSKRRSKPCHLYVIWLKFGLALSPECPQSPSPTTQFEG
ncbi:hypothetical protein TR2A62_0932 [Thalassobium sp. R2A62]|nr:hypothetical protein TR2A62_0932 [Thalassobium sp. R2A62]